MRKKITEEKLYSLREWLTLLHYKKTLWGGWEGEADGANFYFSPEGKTNPQAELSATLQAFLTPAVSKDKTAHDDHPLCRFPARRKWLEKVFGLSLTAVDCPGLTRFRKKMESQSVSVYFSSYYLNTPASAFGHTLLKFKKKDVDLPLLDYGVNYSATVDTGNALLYAIKGMSGLFHGEFSVVPFYYKIREYNDYESRDLWAYELNLSEDHRENLVNHLWELGPTYFDYYYLTENCSYHLLTMLEAANPDLHLTDRLPFYVIPIDTVRVLFEEKNLVTRIEFRPSIRTRFYQGLSQLLPAEQTELRSMAAERKLSEVFLVGLPAERQVRVLDSLIDYLDYRWGKDILAEKGDILAFKQEVLSRRGKIPLQSQTPDPIPPAGGRPDEGHRSRRASLVWGREKSSYWQGEMKFALHDLTDPWEGQPALAQIDFGQLRFRFFPEKGTLKFWDLWVFKVHSITPFTVWERNWSWKAGWGWDRPSFLPVGTKGRVHFYAGGGPSVSIPLGGEGKLPLTLLAYLDVDLFVGKRGYGEAAVGPFAALRWDLSPKHLLWVEWKYPYFWGRPDGESGPRLHKFYSFLSSTFTWGLRKDLSLKLKGEGSRESRDYSLGLNYYF